jgi:hypothetical protein
MKKVILSLLVLGTMQPALAEDLNADQIFGDTKISYDTPIKQSVAQGKQQPIQNANDQLLQGTKLGVYKDTSAGITKFWGDDIIGNVFQNIGQSLGRCMDDSRILTALTASDQEHKTVSKSSKDDQSVSASKETPAVRVSEPSNSAAVK